MQTPLLTDQFFIFFPDAALLFCAELIPLIRFWPFCFEIVVLIPGAAATKEALFLTCLPDRTACMNFMHKAPWHLQTIWVAGWVASSSTAIPLKYLDLILHNTYLLGAHFYLVVGFSTPTHLQA
jgi:hypothetical protein